MRNRNWINYLENRGWNPISHNTLEREWYNGPYLYKTTISKHSDRYVMHIMYKTPTSTVHVMRRQNKWFFVSFLTSVFHEYNLKRFFKKGF